MNTRQVPISVAMVMPEIGLLEDPISPTMREETVTKKAPKITTSTPRSSLLTKLSPGTWGRMVISRIRPRLPNPTILMDRSRSVLSWVWLASPPLFLREPTLPLKEEMMVGMVLNRVMKPPAATAPAPIWRT